MSKAVVELEHAIGNNIDLPLYYFGDDDHVLSCVGSSVLISSLLDPHEQKFVRGHDDSITAIGVGRKGIHFASGQKGQNPDICVWDQNSLKLKYRMQEYESGISSLCFSLDEKLLASCGNNSDPRLLIWDLSTGNLVASTSLPYRKHPDNTIVKFGGHIKDIKKRETKDYQLASIAGQILLFWHLDPHAGTIKSTKFNSGQFHRQYTAFEFSADGYFVFVGSTSGDVSIFSIKQLGIIDNYQICSLGVNDLTVLSSTEIVLAGGDGTITLLQQQPNFKWISVNQIKVSSFAVTSVTSNNKGVLLASIANGDIIQIKVTQNKLDPRFHCENHFDSVLAVAFPPGISDKFATCSSDHSIRYWDGSDYSVISKATFPMNEFNPLCLCFVTDIIFSGWSDGSIRTVDSVNGDILLNKPNAHHSPITCIQSSLNTKFYITGAQKGDIRVWQTSNHSLVCHFQEHRASISQLRMFNDDIHFLSASKDKDIFCWDLRHERRISSHTQHMGGVNDIALFNDQFRFISVGANRLISFWDIRTPKPTRIIEYKEGYEPTCIALAHNNKTFALAGTDEIVHLYDAQTGVKVSEGLGHSGLINNLQYSPDDKQIISVGTEGLIGIWNVFDLE